MKTILFLLFIFLFTICYSLSNDEYKNKMYWGPWRPGIYCGMKTRSQNPVFMGFGWSESFDVSKNGHKCEQTESPYAWEENDGMNYGKHVRFDKNLNCRISHRIVKKDLDWVMEVDVEPINKNIITNLGLTYYIGVEDPEADLKMEIENLNETTNIEQIKVVGSYVQDENDPIGSNKEWVFIMKDNENNRHSNYVDQLDIEFPEKTDLSKTQYAGYSLKSDQWKIHDIASNELENDLRGRIAPKFVKYMDQRKITKDPFLPPSLPNVHFDSTNNVYIFRKNYQLPAKLQFFLHTTPKSMNKIKKKIDFKKFNENFIEKAPILFLEHSNKFNENFDKTFQFSTTYKQDRYYKFAKVGLSNLLGGLGYFSGTWKKKIFKTDGSVKIVEKGPNQLFSACPSRSFFPRGFLWDEGFHQLGILEWNEQITFDVLTHWFNLIDQNGWIPREQILGTEARSRVPEEFVAQIPTNANPPTFFLVLEKLLERHFPSNNSAVNSNNHVFASNNENNQLFLQFLRDNFKNIKKWYDWFTNSQSGLEKYSFYWKGRSVNHTLSSGLDDYPRSRIVSENEMHLDLFCWVAISTRVMSKFHDILEPGTENPYTKDYSNYQKKIELYWNENIKLYSDISNWNNGKPNFTDNVGYINLFPLIARLIPSDSIHLKHIYDAILNENGIWSNFGLRSLSKSDPFFATEENYWRGKIWININYLVLSSLHTKYMNEGIHKDKAKQIYNSLRKNLVENMQSVYSKTGFFFENYDPLNGSGVGARPFNGWSSLIFLIMAERF